MIRGDHRCVRSRYTDVTPHSPLLGGNTRDIQGGALLWCPIQVIQGGLTGKLTVSHHIQYGGRRGDPPLGDVSGRVECGTRGVQ